MGTVGSWSRGVFLRGLMLYGLSMKPSSATASSIFDCVPKKTVEFRQQLWASYTVPVPSIKVRTLRITEGSWKRFYYVLAHFWALGIEKNCHARNLVRNLTLGTVVLFSSFGSPLSIALRITESALVTLEPEQRISLTI